MYGGFWLLWRWHPEETSVSFVLFVSFVSFAFRGPVPKRYGSVLRWRAYQARTDTEESYESIYDFSKSTPKHARAALQMQKKTSKCKKKNYILRQAQQNTGPN